MVNFDAKGTYCFVSGRLTQEQVITLWPRRNALLTSDTQGLDLSALEYSDSAGVAFLLGLVQLAQQNQQTLALVAPSPQLKKLIALYDLEAFFTEEAH